MSMMMAFRPGQRRANPHPYDVVCNGYGLMTGDLNGPKRSGLTSSLPDDMSSVAPTDFGYGALNPKLGAITSYGDMPLGFGQRKQIDIRDPRYRYGINANCSCGLWQKGPETTDIEPTDAQDAPCKRPFHLGTSLYWFNGQYCFKMASTGVVTTEKDFGAGKAATDVAVYWYNGGAQSYAYVAMGDGEKIYRFDGTNWTQHASLEAIAFAVIDQNIWRAHDRNKVTLCNINSDPWTAANWAAPNSYYVGERTFQIKRLLVMPGGELICLKEDQPWVFDVDGSRPLYPGLGLAPDSDAGESLGFFGDSVLLGHGKGLYKIDPDLSIDPVGPDELTENDSPVKGRISCVAGHESFYAYAGMWNDDTGYSYLMQWGSWLQEPKAAPRRIDAWHGSLTIAYAKKMTMMVKTTVHAPTDHSLLIIGFDDGTLVSFILSCVANPLGCSTYRWSLADGEVYLPTWTGKFEANIKALRALIVACYNFSVDCWVDVDYKLSPTGSFTTMPRRFDSGQMETVDFPSGLSAVLVDLKVRMRSNSTSLTPQVAGLGFMHQLHTEFRTIKTVPILADDGLLDHDNKPLRYGATKIVSILRTAYDSPPGTVWKFPDEGSKQMKIIGWDEVQAWDRVSEGWRSAIKLTLGEVVETPITGTYGRLEGLTYGQAELRTYGELETF